MESLSNQEKDRIRENLRVYVAKYPSQNKAVGSLKNTSVGTVSNIVNGKYENISDEMFRNIASQIGAGHHQHDQADRGNLRLSRNPLCVG